MPRDDSVIWTESERGELRRDYGDVYEGRTCIVTGADGRPSVVVTVAWVAVAACVALVAWRKSLLPGLVIAVAIALAGRAAGLP